MDDHHRYSNLHAVNGQQQSQFHPIPQVGGGGGELHSNVLPTGHHYDMLMEHCIPPSTLDMELGCLPGSGRWPRQETLTLLEIRSRLDPKFKESNQKGPLWDEVSRIMSEEHGYQRSGKKCREKFENLYKYYKKTKEGKAGRQDGKHYRFFRQLEALYGTSDTQSHTPTNSLSLPQKHSSSFTLSNSSDFDTSSDDDNNSKWKGITDVIEKQMQRLLDKQEAWLEKMLATLERKEQERARREDDWRRQEALRLEREHQFWASERAWVKARDSALMDALNKLTRPDVASSSSSQFINRKETVVDNSDGSKRRRDSRENVCYFPTGDVFGYCDDRLQNDGVLPSAQGDVGALRFLMGDNENLWENYATKMGSKGDN